MIVAAGAIWIVAKALAFTAGVAGGFLAAQSNRQGGNEQQQPDEKALQEQPSLHAETVKDPIMTERPSGALLLQL